MLLSVIHPSAISLSRLALSDVTVWNLHIVLAALTFMDSRCAPFHFPYAERLTMGIGNLLLKLHGWHPLLAILTRLFFPTSFMPAFSGEASHTYFFRREVSASRILQVPDALFLGFFQKLFADGLAAGKNFSLPHG